MAESRRRKGTDTWHWCSNCNNYPQSNYETIPRRPTSSDGDLCNTCKAKEKDGDCR